MTKERLEEIKRVSEFQIANGSHYGRPAHVILNGNDVKWLIEQAERVQDLENHLKLYDFWYRTAYEQNKRYRGALEFYANEETYETKFATDTDEMYDPFTLIELDEGRKARKALEGEE